jgi:hypothetical protein
MAVTIAGLVIAEREDRSPRLRRWLAGALVAGLVCWAAPLGEQLVHRPGNFVQIARAAKARGETFGPSAGWHSVARTVGVPPWWLRSPRRPFDRLKDVARAPWPTSASALLVLAALIAAGSLGARRGRRDVTYVCAIAFVLCAAVALVAAGTPSSGFLFVSIGYTLWWASVAGMFAWLALGWSLVTLTGASYRARGSLALVPVAAALAFAVTADPGENLQKPLYRPMRSLDRGLDAAVPAGGRVRVEGGSKTLDRRFDFAAGTVYALRRHGARPLAAGLDELFGTPYAPSDRRPDAVIRVACGAAPGRVLERVPDPGPCPVVVALTSP